MPLMTKIRDNMTTFFSVFAGLFVVYIVLDWGMDITGRRHNTQQAEASEIGKIDGEAISYVEFSNQLKLASDNQKAQTGTEPDDNQMRLLRDQVWDQMIEQRLYDREIKRLGITVSDKEVYDMLMGDNPPDYLKKQFTDSTGTFLRPQYEAALKNPANRAKLIQLETGMRMQREREKLQSIILASVQISDGDVLQRYADQNVKYEGDYAFLDPNVFVKDDEVKASDDDLRKYYNEHSDEFKVEATRRLKYVLFNEAPSKADSQSVADDIADIKKRTEAGADFIDLAKTYSETPVTDTYFKHGELSQDKEPLVFSAKPGDIIGPLQQFDGYHLIKVLDIRNGKDDFVRASHILIRIEGKDSVKALKTAKEIFAKAKKGDDFGKLAKENSADGSASSGGDLGWFGKGRMVKEFDEAAFKAKVGQIVGPVKTQFGYHIIKVTGRENREVKIADIRMAVHISLQTKNDIEQKAQEFQYLAKQDDFLKEAQTDKYTVNETGPFQKDAGIPAIGPNSALNKFAFNNKLGAISEVITLQNGTGVFMISEVKQAGIRPFEELKASLVSRLQRERKVEKTKALASTMRQSLAPGDILQKLATTNPNVQAGHFPPTALSGSIPGIGREMSVIGAISVLNAGEISKPIEGVRGVYLVKLTSKTPFDSTAYAAQRNMLRNQLLTEKRNRFLSDWSTDLKKSAEIVDNRDVFYH